MVGSPLMLLDAVVYQSQLWQQWGCFPSRSNFPTFFLLPRSTLWGSATGRFKQMKRIKAEPIWPAWLGLEALPPWPFPDSPIPTSQGQQTSVWKPLPLREKEKDESDRGRMKIKLWTAGAAAGQRDSRGAQSGSISCLGVTCSCKQHRQEPWRAGAEKRATKIGARDKWVSWERKITGGSKGVWCDCYSVLGFK